MLSLDNRMPIFLSTKKNARKASNEGLTGSGGLGFAVTKQMESLIKPICS